MRKISMTKAMAALAFAVTMASGIAAPGLASADTKIFVDGVFTDGATLKGFVDFNVNGYVANYNLVTTAGGLFSGSDFKSGQGDIATSGGNTGPSITFYGSGDYNGDQLTLVSALPFADLTGNSLTASTYECQNSYGCPTSGDVRFLGAAGVLSRAPEPSAWALMLLGFGGLGATLRASRRKSHLAAA